MKGMMEKLLFLPLILLLLVQPVNSFASKRPFCRISCTKLQAGFGSKSTPSSGAANKNRQIKTVTANDACVCGSGDTYGACCNRYHGGILSAAAADPVTLTKARYSAFALGIPEFLIDTTHPEHKVGKFIWCRFKRIVVCLSSYSFHCHARILRDTRMELWTPKRRARSVRKMTEDYLFN